jgi:three-Cys-motif partner protein
MAGAKQRQVGEIRFDEIGCWSEVKLDIIRKYATAYSRILSMKRIHHAYIDGFAGSGLHLSRTRQDFVPGSPLNALHVDPPFQRYYLVDLDGDKVDRLRVLPEVHERANVHLFQGDCNEVLLKEVFPQVRFNDYRRALCVLDPYGLHLNWQVIDTAGKMGSIEVFLNFPIMDINRNALWRRPGKVTAEGHARMTAFWGDESWRTAAYQSEPTLFGDVDDVKLGNRDVVEAFARRLKTVAGFRFVPDPLPMRNSANAVVYYLIFASHQPVAAKIVRDIFDKYRHRQV